MMWNPPPPFNAFAYGMNMLAKSSALLFPLKLRYTNELVIDASK